MTTTQGDDLERVAEHYQTHDTSADLERAEYDGGTTAEPMITTSLRLPKPVMDAIRGVADVRGMRATALMREWLEQRLAEDADAGEQVIPVSALMAFVAETAARDAGRRAS